MRFPKFNNFNPLTTVRDIIADIWVLVLCGIIGFTSCYIYNSVFVGSRYTSKMTLSVNIMGYTSNATSTSIARTVTIAEAFNNIMNSKALVNVVERGLDGKLTATITAVQIPSTNLVQVYVTDTTPKKAYVTAQLIHKNYNLLSDKSFNNIVIKPVENATMPRSVSNTNQVFRSCVLNFFLFALVGALIIAVLSILRDTVKTEAGAEELLDTKRFGTVVHINKQRSKIKKQNDGILLTNPLISHLFRKSFEDMAIRLASYNKTRDIRAVTVSSISENEGKTTISVNLALALADMGKKVALVDADFKLPSVYKFFGKNEHKNDKQLGDYIFAKCTLDEIGYVDKNSGVTVYFGINSYKNSSEIVGSSVFRNLIKQLREEYDFVIVDTPPTRVAIDAETVAGITDAVLLVVRQDLTFVEPINDYLSNIDKDKVLGFVLNDADILSPAMNSAYYYGGKEAGNE